MPRGGRREGAGRKPLPDGARRLQRSVYLEPATEVLLKAIADRKGIPLARYLAQVLEHHVRDHFQS